MLSMTMKLSKGSPITGSCLGTMSTSEMRGLMLAKMFPVQQKPSDSVKWP